jgi:hypothetical protein
MSLPTQRLSLHVRDADDQLGNSNDDLIAVLERPDKLSILSGIEAIEGPLSVVRLLWSILAGRLLRVLTTASGTLPTFALQRFHQLTEGKAD